MMQIMLSRGWNFINVYYQWIGNTNNTKHEVSVPWYHYLHHYLRFGGFDSPSSSFWVHFWRLECPGARNCLWNTCFVLFLLPVHWYYRLVRFQHLDSIICIIIDDFMFLTPIQLHFGPIFDVWNALEPRNCLWNTCFVLFLLPIHWYLS